MSTEVLTALKEHGERQGKAFEEFKKTNDERLSKIEKGEHVDAILEEKLDKVNNELSEFSSSMDSMRAKMNAARWYEGEMKSRGMSDSDIEYRNCFWEGVRHRVKFAGQSVPLPKDLVERAKSCQPKHLKAAYNPSTASEGLEWAPDDYIPELWRDVQELSPVLADVKIYNTSRNQIEVPTHAAVNAGTWVAAEGARGTSTQATTGSVTIPTFELSTRYQASREAMDDVVLDLASIIRDDQSEQIARALGQAIVKGGGSGEPTGFAHNPTVNLIEGAATVTVDLLLDVFYELKTSYSRDAKWYMNKSTILAIRKLAGSNQDYAWSPGLGAAEDTILGRTIVETPDMDDIGGDTSDNEPVAFGNLRRGYAIAQRHGFRTLVDPYSNAATGTIDLYGFIRVGGKTIKPEAMAFLHQ